MLPGFKGQQVLWVRWDLRVLKDHKVHRDPKDFRAYRELPVPRVLRE